MKEPVKLEFENNEFKCHLDEAIAIIKVKCNAFYSLTDLDVSRRILQWFDLVAEEENVKAVLLLNEKGCYGNTAYEVFLSSITGKDPSQGEHNIFSPQERSQIRTREVNVLNSFIMACVNYKRFVVSGLNGTIVTPFFGASLGSNFRFISENSVLSLNHAKYGLHPGGALPFFLPKYIGFGRASEYVFNGGEISAKEALEMGLVNKIFPEENFDETCINETKILCDYDRRYIRWTKDLLTPFKGELVDYLHKEEKFIERY